MPVILAADSLATGLTVHAEQIALGNDPRDALTTALEAATLAERRRRASLIHGKLQR